MIKLDDALAGVKNLGLDTAPVIYFVEKHPRYDALVTEIFRRIDAETAKRAATLRAKYNLRTPDALQVATALEFDCQAFLTNDIALKRVTELRVLILDELEL